MQINIEDSIPTIIWDRKSRYAIIAFLIMSINGKMGAESLKKLDVFMGIIEEEVDSFNDEEDDDSKLQLLIEMREAIIQEGNTFLDSISQEENHHDFLINELDCLIDGCGKCYIGSGYALNSKNNKPIIIKGDASRLYEYLDLVIFDDYSIGQRRFLQRLAHKWAIDKSVLPVLENAAKNLSEINMKRHDIQNRDMSYREAVNALAELDEHEKVIWDKLKKMGINKGYRTSYKETYASAIAAISNWTDNPITEDEAMDDMEDEYTITDRIGDGIVGGIMKFGELVSAPFEWLSGVR